MNMGWAIFWLAMIVVAVVTEAATNQLVSIWFCAWRSRRFD